MKFDNTEVRLFCQDHRHRESVWPEFGREKKQECVWLEGRGERVRKLNVIDQEEKERHYGQSIRRLEHKRHRIWLKFVIDIGIRECLKAVSKRKTG